MTDQRVLFYSVAVDFIRSLLFSYLLLCNKLSKNATALNIIIYLCLILNSAGVRGDGSPLPRVASWGHLCNWTQL